MKTAKIINRMHRLQGQLKAVEKMLESDKSHKEVLIQMEAVTSGLKSLKAEYIRELIRTANIREIETFIDLIN